ITDDFKGNRAFGDSIIIQWRRHRLNFQPQKTIGTNRQWVWLLCNDWKLDITKHLDWSHSLKFSKVQLHWLCEAREVSQAEHLLISILSHIGQDLSVCRRQKFEGTSSKDLEEFAQCDHVAHPVQ